MFLTYLAIPYSITQFYQNILDIAVKLFNWGYRIKFNCCNINKFIFCVMPFKLHLLIQDKVYKSLFISTKRFIFFIFYLSFFNLPKWKKTLYVTIYFCTIVLVTDIYFLIQENSVLVSCSVLEIEFWSKSKKK